VEQRRNVGGVLGALALVGMVGVLALGLGVGRGTDSAPSGGFAQEATAVPPPTLAQPASSGASDLDAVAVVERVAPAVVTVNNLQQLGDATFGGGTDPQQAGVGTGFIIDDEGHIVTNQHVVAGGDQFEVIFADGEERSAELIGADPLSDLAVVRIEGDLPATVTLGDSDALRVGQPVLALGSPLGEFTNTVTEGIVSALNRDFPRESPCVGIYTNLIQHDAAINPGNSGGPLFNAAGEVVGVNTLGIPSIQGQPVQGLFFAVPASTVREITTEIIEDGEVDYPLLGIEGLPVTDAVAAQANLPTESGQLVQAVRPGGPAEEAGFEAGDVIVAINGERIDERNSLTEALFAHEPGETIDVTVRRGDEEITEQVTLDRREELLPPECFSENIVP
jgi:2-alkenal reductase